MWVFCVGSLFCGVILGVLSSLAIILLRQRADCFTLIVLWVSLSLPYGAVGLLLSNFRLFLL